MSGCTPVTLAYSTYDPEVEADEILPPIIFLHAATGSKEMWCDVAQTIANETRRKAYAIDARNHGDTEWTDEFNFDINADDLLHFMDTLSIPKAVLVGHSMGGTTSIRAALKSPERVDMVIVEDMLVRKFSQDFMNLVMGCACLMGDAVKSIPADCPEEDAIREMFKYISEKVPEESRPLFNPTITNVKMPFKRDEEGRYSFKSNLDVILKAMSDAGTLMTEPKGIYEGPSYFIYGTDSFLKVNEDEENILKFFPNAELIPVEKADHSIHMQYPEQFIDIVVEKILKQKSDA